MKHKIVPLLEAIIIGFILIVFTLSALHPNIASVANAQNVTGWRTITLLNAPSITQTTNGAGIYIPDFGVADCYSKLTFGSAQTATVDLQHSANNANWVTLYTYAAAITDGVAFTHTPLYGNYTRADVTLGMTNPITVVVQCVAKNQ